MHFPRALLFTGLTAVLLASSPGSALAGPRVGNPSRATNQKVDRAVRESMHSGSTTETVIITVKPGYRDTLRIALKQHGDVIRSEHPLIEALAVELHSGDVDALSEQDWIESIAADAFVSAKGAGGNTASHNNYSSHGGHYYSQVQYTQGAGYTLRDTLGLPHVAPASYQWTGGYQSTGDSGVTVALIDSGIAPSDDFAGRITAFYDFTRGGIPVAPFDDYGHGTHLAGLIASSGKGSNYEFQGVAPDVRLVGFKVLDRTGRGKTRDVIKALEYLIANKARLNVQIVNLSLGHPIYAPAKYDPLVQAVEKASAAGLIVVTAAGNYGEKRKTGEPGYAGITSPGNAPSAITVGAAMTRDTTTHDDDAVAPYSGRGPTWFDGYAKPDVIAPGHNLPSDTTLTSCLYSLLPSSRGQSKNGLAMLRLSGTSMATGVTSGVVALLVQQHNQNGFHTRKPLTANLVKAMLQYTAIPLAGAEYLTQGAGEINAAGAIALAKLIDTDVAAGKWWLGGGVSASTAIGAQSYAWSRHVIWGDTVLTGHVLYYSSAVWSSNIVWGDNIVWGTTADIAGDNIVWGTSMVWGTHIVWSDRVIGQMAGDNIVWGTAAGDNIVWGTVDGDNIVWGTCDGDNIVWGTWDGDNIVWGTSDGDDIVWGTSDGDNIVWGTATGDNVVWGTTLPAGKSGGSY